MTLAPRQIHLDFHTSEAIPDIAANFDPRTFAETARKAAVSSITVFARCHHGWLYYPSKRFPEINSSQFEKPQFASGAGAGAARCRYQGAGIYHGSVGLSFRADPSRVADQKARRRSRGSPLYRSGLSPVVVR